MSVTIYDNMNTRNSSRLVVVVVVIIFIIAIISIILLIIIGNSNFNKYSRDDRRGRTFRVFGTTCNYQRCGVRGGGRPVRLTTCFYRGDLNARPIRGPRRDRHENRAFFRCRGRTWRKNSER